MATFSEDVFLVCMNGTVRGGVTDDGSNLSESLLEFGLEEAKET